MWRISTCANFGNVIDQQLIVVVNSNTGKVDGSRSYGSCIPKFTLIYELLIALKCKRPADKTIVQSFQIDLLALVWKSQWKHDSNLNLIIFFNHRHWVWHSNWLHCYFPVSDMISLLAKMHYSLKAEEKPHGQSFARGRGFVFVFIALYVRNQLFWLVY